MNTLHAKTPERLVPVSRFEIDTAHARLRAITVIDVVAADEADGRADQLERIAARLNEATEQEATKLRAGARFSANVARGELLLSREIALDGLDFEGLLTALRRLDRVANRWCLMRPAHVSEAATRFLPFLQGSAL